jgi:Mg-chelatase subunit ChlD
MIKNSIRKWSVLLILIAWVLVGYTPTLAFVATPAGIETQKTFVGSSAPQPQEQPKQTPQIILVLDVSRSMGSLVLPGELPADLAALRTQIEQVENDSQYLRLSQELNDILANPEVEAAYQAWSEASAAIDSWLSNNGYGQNQFAISDYVAALLADYGCDASYDAFIAYSSGSLAELDEKLVVACPSVTPNETQQQAIKDVVAYVEHPDYQSLRAAEIELFEAYTEARDALNYQEVREQFKTVQENSNYSELQAEFETLAAAEDIPSRLDLVKLAAQALLDLSRLDTLASERESPIGVVDFSNNAALLQPLTTDYGLIKRQIDTLQPLYETNIGAGLDTALAELAQNGDPNQPVAIILFTDGQNNVGAPTEQMLAQIPGQAQEMGVNICTVGFGNQESDIDASFMRSLAEATGGQYLFATTAEELVSFFIACRQGVVSRLVDQLAGVIRQGETVETGRIEVREDVGELTLTFNYLQGRLSIELVDSEGNVIDASYPGFTIEQGEGIQRVKITNPRPGEWTVRVTANEAPPDGVVYNIVINTETSPTPTPTPAEAPATPTPAPAESTTSTPVSTPVTSAAASSDQMTLYLAGGIVLLGLILAIGGGVWVYVYLKRSGRV